MKYPQENPMELEPYYSEHIAAMTEEGLHSKSAIAEQLARRDKTIAGLEQARKLLAQWTKEVYEPSDSLWADTKEFLKEA